MELKIYEYDGFFSANLRAEDLEEAALLTRMGINGMNKIEIDVNAYKGGDFSAWLRIPKIKRSTTRIPRKRS